MKKPVSRITIGSLEEVMQPDALKATLAEFICTIAFVFPAEAAVLFFTKINPSSSPTHIDNLAFALTHGFALFAAIAVGLNISGGHTNPAITFGVFIGGYITFVRSILYWIARCLGAIVSMYLLKLASNGKTVYGWSPSSPFHAIIYEIIMVFMLVYAYYATILDRKRGNLRAIGPIVIGLLCAMNPAMALSVSWITWTWGDHWVYWLGTFVGAQLPDLVYQTIFIGEETYEYEQLPITKP
ncbi:unnamed protein product [Withania somnifera]